MQHTVRQLGAALALSAVAWAAHAATLESAAQALGVSKVQSVEFSGGGRWFQFGQAPAPGLPWPQFDVSRYVASVHYPSASARVQIDRLQTIEPARVRPTPVQQRVDQYVNGAVAWNVGVAPAAANATPQGAAAEERAAEIWATPQGFVKAALAHQAVSKPLPDDAVEVSFSVGGKYRYVGTINASHQVERVRTWIDNPVLGDTEVDTRFTHYRDFSGVPFPSYIERSQGGFRVLSLAVGDVKWNSLSAFEPNADVVAKQVPVHTVDVKELAKGVYYLTGGTHHSVAIDQKDHVVLVEAPLNEARSQALIAKVKALLPGKPIKHLVNTHVHFDHSGGLRTFVAEGASIVTHQDNVPYYQAAWRAPHKLSPDRLAQSGKPARFEPFTRKLVLSDGQRQIEVHHLAGNTHNDAFAFVYLPAEKILIEGDAYTPLAAGAQPPATPNPFAVNLLDNIEALKLDVDQIAALHGPGVVKLGDLKSFVKR